MPVRQAPTHRIEEPPLTAAMTTRPAEIGQLTRPQAPQAVRQHSIRLPLPTSGAHGQPPMSASRLKMLKRLVQREVAWPPQVPWMMSTQQEPIL